MADQQLNSLDRFRKQPGKLVLEEHSHCEVPAGCGGVVLRWRNPNATLPLNVSLYTPKPGAYFLDGAELNLSRVNLIPGPHVVAVALEDADVAAGLLMFAAYYDDGRSHKSDSTLPLAILSAADGSWKFTLQPPDGEAWMTTAFDDSQWQALAIRPTPDIESSQFGASQCRLCARQGALCLGLAIAPLPSQANIWIRKLFTVTLPQ